MEALKSAGTLILSITVFVAVTFVVLLFIAGAAAVSARILPYLDLASLLGIALCTVVLIPLAIFRATRVAAIWGFFIASHLFALDVWICAFVMTYKLWGVGGVMVGLFLGIVGVVPLGMIASAFHGLWFTVGELALGIFVVSITRKFAFFLAGTLDRNGSELTLSRNGRQAEKYPAYMRRRKVLLFSCIGVGVVVVIAVHTLSWSSSKESASYDSTAMDDHSSAVVNSTHALSRFSSTESASYFGAAIHDHNSAAAIIDQASGPGLVSTMSQADSQAILNLDEKALDEARKVDITEMNNYYPGFGDHFENEFIKGMELIIEHQNDWANYLKGQILVDHFGDWYQANYDAIWNKNPK